MKKKTRSLLLALPTVLALLLFFIGPMVYILIRTLAQGGSGAFLKFFTDEFYLKILWTTLRVSLLSTVVSLLLGYPTAYYMARTRSKMKTVMMIIILSLFWSAPLYALTAGW